MRIRDDQIDTLAKRQSRTFRDRLREFAEARLQQAVTSATVDALCDRARTYGLVSERDCAGYVTVAIAAGVRPPTPDPEWIRSCLSDRTVFVPDRLRRLFSQAKLHLN
jgi:hypothetical protein